MQSQNRVPLVLMLCAVTAWTATAATARSQVPPVPSSGLVRQIDHVVIGSDEPEQLFRLFSEKLGLPVVWPFESYGTFSSGGVGFGNVNVELSRGGRGPGIIGVALEPGSVPELITGLDALGLKHGSPEPFSRRDSSGKDSLLWTTVGMTNLPPAPASLVFFCKYNFDVDAARRQNLRELQNRGGGALGIESATELVMGVRDIAAAQRDWRLLLGQGTTGRQDILRIGSGPAIRLVAAQEDQLEFLRIKVKSLARARAFLRVEEMLGSDVGREIALKLPRAAGIDVRLVE
jgi:hypothetical protein